MTQVAADVLGIPPSTVRVELGDSELPPAPVSGGSMTTASVTPAVKAAAEDLLNRLKGCAIEDPASPLHALKVEDVAAGQGSLHASGKVSVGYTEVLRSARLRRLEAEAKVSPGLEIKKYAMNSFGAQFSEVRVDSDTGEVRVARHCAVFDVGRVINPKTARSQALGGITQGIGMALLEHTVYDHLHGRVVTNNLADYAVPVNADIPEIDVSFVGDPDFIISPVGARGIGEIGITGVAPAIANAVYHATGVRVRDLPITPDKLLHALR
jgi:xanthine dehydrogenase YagR molybdenum-binding subunit